jgi:arabinogalactan endo-1,4-beta-galactosidase
MGADLSFLDEMEERGVIFRADGAEVEPLTHFREKGIEYVRLRVWNDPVDRYCGRERTLLMARRIADEGMKLCIDFHYSDTWAYPAQQTMPAAWGGLRFEDLSDAVYRYTRDVVSALDKQGTPPHIVQIGNEIMGGILWDIGRVGEGFETRENWDRLAILLRSGIRGVRDGTKGARIMLHLEAGGDNEACVWFLDRIVAREVHFDYIGLSFYPWWHGTLEDLESNMSDLAERYGREIVVVETAYPWTLEWNDDERNMVRLDAQLHAGYAATVDGQRAFIRDLIRLVQSLPDGKGRGIFYWAPDWVSAPGKGSGWENLALFDFNTEALDSFDAFSAE